MNRTGLTLLFIALIPACEKRSPSPATEPDASPSAVSESAKPAPSEAPSGPVGSTAWNGAYASVAGTLYVPATWKGVRWAVADVDAGLGGGTMSLSVDGTTGRVRGALDGPLGPAIIDGYAADGRLTATVYRSDPTDRGFEGTLQGVLTDGGADGTMSVSLAEVSAVRAVTFKLTPGGGTALAR